MGRSGVTGIDEMSTLANALRRIDLTEDLAEPAYAAIAREYRRLRPRIPRDTGALARSLTHRSDRAHFEGLQGRRITYGSTLPQATYQAHRIPPINPDAVIRALSKALWSHLATHGPTRRRR